MSELVIGNCNAAVDKPRIRRLSFHSASYKKGQGNWTAWGLTPVAQLAEQPSPKRQVGGSIPSWRVVLLGFWVMNKPTNVDFLIATDSEMKKVNWTSRKDLIGSTKIVIIFMFSVAIFLFVADILFTYLFFSSEC
jgi:preprotein translocase SecE subunit